ncbi:MAG: hypothetical protein R3B68_05005 [Phycisphaerales bacterium]
MPATWSDNLFQWSGVMLASVAAAWAVFSVLGTSPAALLDRPRRITTRRCPGRWRWWPVPRHNACWYDLTGVPRGSAGRTTCPECGSTWPERALRRRRRRWKLAAFLLIPLQLAAYAVWCVPRVQREGWMGLVPTTALVLMVDRMEHVPSPLASVGAGPPRVGERLFVSLRERVSASALTQWHWNRLLDWSNDPSRRISFHFDFIDPWIDNEAQARGAIRCQHHLQAMFPSQGIHVRVFARSDGAFATIIASPECTNGFYRSARFAFTTPNGEPVDISAHPPLGIRLHDVSVVGYQRHVLLPGIGPQDVGDEVVISFQYDAPKATPVPAGVTIREWRVPIEEWTPEIRGGLPETRPTAPAPTPASGAASAP